jgi:alkaline phosphatase
MHRRHLVGIRPFAVALALAAVAIPFVAKSACAAKNVIIMIADGSGFNTWLAASMYQAKVGNQIYDQPGWRCFGCSTYSLNLSKKPTGNETQDRELIYDPLKAWNASLVPAKNNTTGFAGYVYLRATYAESPAAATAMASGRKTYNKAINWSNDNCAMRGLSIAEIAKARGKSSGVVTTVQWSDATPAALGGAHNVNRDNHAEIAKEMLGGGWLDVIMGGGNPDFDNNGRPLPATAKRDYQWVGGKDAWTALKQGKGGWKLIERKAEFEALTSGSRPPKVLGTAEVAKTLQERRGRSMTAGETDVATTVSDPFAVPFNHNVPSLPTMTKAAIHCLDGNPKGFYLVIEGGAIDWANHANDSGRMIEEQVDFLKAVEAVVDWVDKHSNWDDTLLILTADHECGLLWGPKSDKAAFDPIEDSGPGRLPGMKHNSHWHTNSLVPLYVRGPGSQRFAQLVKGADAKAAAVWHFSGKYLDNTDIFTVMMEEVGK